ncbi:MAG: hypothetical protein COC06_04575 [Bacteroidales bacterium]|nr:MAG: hypothetical protein COC06_04575 [Bacteroidales bacterium]
MDKKISRSDKEIVIKSFVKELYLNNACWTQGKLPKGFDYYFSEEPFRNNEGKVKQQVYRYITNSDGSIRWIIPANSKFPGFLDLYNSSGWKAKLFGVACKLLFRIKLSFLIAPDKFYLLSTKPILQDEWLMKKDFDSFAVFTGTVGPNRKVLFALHKENETIGFVKHPISIESSLLVANENVILQFFKDTQFEKLSIPLGNNLGNGDLFTNDMRRSKCKSEADFTNTHASALQELYTLETEKLQLENSAFYKNLKNQINNIYEDSKLPFHSEISKQLHILFESLNLKQELSFSWAHMDFTPWNLFVDQGNNHVGIIDWELAKPRVPILFDAFHFVFQSQILLKNQNFNSIFKCLNDQVKNKPIIEDLIRDNDIDFELHYRLYLLYNISYYLNVYQDQVHLHLQVNWLTKVWYEALFSQASMTKSRTFRAVFIADLFQSLDNKKYAWLHACDTKIEEINLNSDIDLLVVNSVQKEVMEFCKTHVLLSRIHHVKKSFMTTVELYFMDGSFLSLDLITRLVRKNLVFMDANKVLENSILNSEGICVPSKKDDLNYLVLFYTLNFGSIPNKYKEYYFKMEGEMRIPFIKFLNEEYRMTALSLAQMFNELHLSFFVMRKILLKMNLNRGFCFLKNTLNYLIDTAGSFVLRKGIVVTFSGVDGVGKSTLINDLALRLRNDYRKKVVILRHRPSLLPILSACRYGKKEAEKRAANTLPHQGKNKGILSSLVRFLYYFSDYLLGQIYVNFRFVLRNYVVIYDRYYFDFINDSKRSNIVLSKNFVQTLYSFIHKPKQNFFLYAKSEVIRQRKKELSASEINELTGNYMQMFTRFTNKYENSEYHCIENINRDKTLQKILNHVVPGL